MSDDKVLNFPGRPSGNSIAQFAGDDALGHLCRRLDELEQRRRALGDRNAAEIAQIDADLAALDAEVLNQPLENPRGMAIAACVVYRQYIYHGTFDATGAKLLSLVVLAAIARGLVAQLEGDG